METIGDRIKRLRKKELDKTQKEFGDRIGLKPNSVSDIENGKNNLTDQTANAICREFNVNKDWLLTGNGDMYDIPSDDVADIVSELLGEKNPFYDIIVEVMKVYNKLDEPSQKALKNLSQELLDNLKKRD